MPRIRLFELAKALGMSSRELSGIAQDHGLSLTSASRLLSASEEAELRAIVTEVQARPSTGLTFPPSAVVDVTALDPAHGADSHIGTCSCCGRHRVRLHKVHFGSGQYEQTSYCPECRDHRGNLTGDLVKRNEDHLRIWQAAHATAVREGRERYDRGVATYVKQVADLTAELQARPFREVPVGLDEIQRISDARDGAYRSRDTAFQVLCEVRLLHREGKDGQCQCGARYEQCQTAQLVNGYPALEQWEITQFERHRLHRRSDLPANHPARFDHTWRPHGWQDPDDEDQELDTMQAPS